MLRRKRNLLPLPRKPARFSELFNSLFLGLTRGSQEAQWVASTDVSEAHEGERTGANTLLAIFQGDKKVIEGARSLLEKRKTLPPMVARQLDKLLLAAAEGPGTIPRSPRRAWPPSRIRRRPWTASPTSSTANP